MPPALIFLSLLLSLIYCQGRGGMGGGGETAGGLQEDEKGPMMTNYPASW